MRDVTVTVACVQLAARPLGQAEKALDDAVAGIFAAAARGAQVVVLPECAYPGYVLLQGNPYHHIPSAEAALQAVSRAARQCGVCVAFGIARNDAEGRLRNEAVFFDRRGVETARYAKMYLWNFDGCWFTPGVAVPAFDTEYGRMGMMICADGRMPEIARTLAKKGAWLVLDPTAWVSVGRSYHTMHNPQVDFMLRTRARENGIWIAAADKCGSEYSTVHYVGQSLIVSPTGDVAACGPADAPAIVVADVTRSRGRPFVAALTAAERRALVRRVKPATRKRHEIRIGILAGPLRAGRNDAVKALRAQGADAVVDTSASAAAVRSTLRRIAGLRAHIINGARMLAPEPARAAAIDGADVIVWATPPRDRCVRDVARTRALENRVYVVVCSRADAFDPACIVDPNGFVCGEALESRPSGFVGTIDLDAARDKLVVPGTHAFAARVPSAFALFDRGKS